MSNHKDIVNLIKKLSGQSNLISVPRIFIEITGSLEAAAVLSQAVYWSDKGDKDGWFYKSVREWHDEIGIKRYALEGAVNMLVEMGFIQTTVKGAGKAHAQTAHYRVDLPLLADYVYSHCSKSDLQVSANPTKSDLQVSAGGFADFCISSLTLNYLTRLLISLESEQGRGRKRTSKKKDESLRIDATEKGVEMLRVLSVAYKDKERTPPEYFKNSIQRDDYLKVFSSLNGELPELTRKAVARDITGLDRLLSWLEKCVENQAAPAKGKQHGKHPASNEQPYTPEQIELGKRISEQYRRQMAEIEAQRNGHV